MFDRLIRVVKRVGKIARGFDDLRLEVKFGGENYQIGRETFSCDYCFSQFFSSFENSNRSQLKNNLLKTF